MRPRARRDWLRVSIWRPDSPHGRGDWAGAPEKWPPEMGRAAWARWAPGGRGSHRRRFWTRRWTGVAGLPSHPAGARFGRGDDSEAPREGGVVVLTH